LLLVAGKFSELLMTPLIQKLLAKYRFASTPLPVDPTPTERKERVS